MMIEEKQRLLERIENLREEIERKEEEIKKLDQKLREEYASLKEASESLKEASEIYRKMNRIMTIEGIVNQYKWNENFEYLGNVDPGKLYQVRIVDWSNPYEYGYFGAWVRKVDVFKVKDKVKANHPKQSKYHTYILLGEGKLFFGGKKSMDSELIGSKSLIILGYRDQNGDLSPEEVISKSGVRRIHDRHYCIGKLFAELDKGGIVEVVDGFIEKRIIADIDLPGF